MTLSLRIISAPPPQPTPFALPFASPTCSTTCLVKAYSPLPSLPCSPNSVPQASRKKPSTSPKLCFGVLCVVCSALVLLGVVSAPLLVDIIAYGFHAEKRELTIRIVRILFPGTGMLVMSAWCLGVLNSHHRFLLSYTAPVAMNAAMIATLGIFGGVVQDRLAMDLAWGFVLGSVLQFLVQLPRVLQLLPTFRPTLEMRSEQVRTVLRNFGTIFLGRGVVQFSAVIDSIIASKLPDGAVASLAYAQVISMLPISLFSMSVSAAELPTLSGAIGDSQEEVTAFLRGRLSAGLRRIAFFVVPSAVAFLNPWRCGYGRGVSIRSFPSWTRDLCLGHTRRVVCRVAGERARATLLFRFLRFARYSNPAALCVDPCCAYHRSRIPVCFSSSAMARYRR